MILMSRIQDCPVTGLDREFPDVLHVLSYVGHSKYGCYCHHGVHGLATFKHEFAARWFGDMIELSGVEVVLVSFDEAREIAKGRPFPIVSVMLLDDISDPVIHYVK